MESLIAKLLGAFEQGKMNRRELVQSLALAATGLAASGSVTPAAAAGSAVGAGKAGQFSTRTLGHISYSVADYGRSRDFYSELMGWEVVTDDGERQAQLMIGDIGSIILRSNPNVQPQEREGRPPLTSVIDHIAWGIEDFDPDSVREELERRDLNPRRDQGGPPGNDSYHVLDPDGWDLQISKIV
jgi:catechol 2,3-dioxygenase-like lactoylglutathione lyase family enzyme